jgi:uncharacterized BrkB/YihY/UPF0761 family membrane protein
MNTLERFALAIFAVLTLAGALFFGLVVLLVLGTAIAVIALYFYLRAWWSGRAGTVTGRTPPSGQVIDAEYTVISRRDE